MEIQNKIKLNFCRARHEVCSLFEYVRFSFFGCLDYGVGITGVLSVRLVVRR